MSEPDQIDIMSEPELRVELRRCVKRIAELKKIIKDASVGIYKDSEGVTSSLERMIKCEPEWVASRFQHMEAAIECAKIIADENKVLREQNLAMNETCVRSAWIPVTELPESGGVFDVWVKSKENAEYGRRVINVGYSVRVGFGFHQRQHPAEHISHYRAIPEGPE